MAFHILAFSVGCLYFFNPPTFSWWYAGFSCHTAQVIAEYFLTGIVLSLSIIVDAFIVLYLLKSFKSQRGGYSRDSKSFRFMIQTLVLALSNGCFTFYLYTRGAYTIRIAMADHVVKLCDLILALIYSISIAFVNPTVRKEVIKFVSRSK
ncbi:hypothetical protein Y032_0432g1346 [Ancylostoma ceylanicum]|uniref:7TM GPCR serpentine receptor class x (Srx) domain-containing protein n=1 Tax=Ancylostoma ceylanicum TaxID=53326 RepID=A0A016X1Z7_9BILA|nr:hypothetical protein Y032_0432g1346 [Ancylostoma ceylanicum]